MHLKIAWQTGHSFLQPKQDQRDAAFELPCDSSPKLNINSTRYFVICSNFAFREEKIKCYRFCCSLQKWSALLCIARVRSFILLRSIWYSLKIKNLPEE